jgi:prevent-host-death family protein
MTRLSATEAARSFSDVLNRVAAGEEIEVVRNGAPVALLTPVHRRLVSAERFRAILESAPPVDDAFARDVRELRAAVPAAAEPWPS